MHDWRLCALEFLHMLFQVEHQKFVGVIIINDLTGLFNNGIYQQIAKNKLSAAFFVYILLFLVA